MIKRISFILPLGILIVVSCAYGFTHSLKPHADTDKAEQLRKKINHIVVIYQENWSFDGLYGKFENARGLSDTVSTRQVGRKGEILFEYPKPYVEEANKKVDEHFVNVKTPTHPYNLVEFLKSDTVMTGDLIHRYYTEQRQINGGKMDKFVAWSNNPGLVQSYFDASNLPEGKLAKEFTLCDNFFHSAFGGSFLNHIWLITAASPKWLTAPKKIISDSIATAASTWIYDNQVDTDLYVINTTYSIYKPAAPAANYRNDVANLMPGIQLPTIGDRLNEAKISWAWYAGGWDDAMAGKADATFQYHHQPFVYFENFKDGSENKKQHLKDETEFTKAIQNNKLPAVSFIKPLGKNNEHPGYADVRRGQQHVDSLVRRIMKSKYWDDTVIIIAYDENGGRWDHVAPPKIDRWGPGSRVPAIIISPFAKKKNVDHTQYETVSILKFIETRFNLKPLSSRDAKANDLLNAFDF